MRALGRHELPASIHLDGVSYRLLKTVKHDFWAATGFYHDPHGRRVVLKISRVEDFAGLPMIWIGRWLCRREQRFYQRLADLPNVPRVVGTVGPTGFVHEYVAGQPLSADREVPDGFFHQLQELLHELHERGVAYVDTNKPQNILIGDDGKPHLIDFQISWDSSELGGCWISRCILKHFQNEDFYHILKHKRRIRPDELTRAEREQSRRKSWPLRVHRLLLKPYLKFRRSTYHRLRQTGRLLPEGSK